MKKLEEGRESESGSRSTDLSACVAFRCIGTGPDNVNNKNVKRAN